MELDLRSVLCEKEELVSDRDAYRAKHDRLSQELLYIMNGDEKRVCAFLLFSAPAATYA